MERLTKRIDLGNGRCTVDFSNERCGDFLTDHKAGVRALFEKLAEYEDLEEQGLLIRLPCRVGDTIYRINQYAKESIISMKVLQIRFGELCIGNSFLRIDAINDEDMGEFCYFKENIGKTVFLTKEEAEAALKEINKNKGE